ncbi:MAG: alpha/beta hydrolase [Pseudomonadales bacterium]|nr:alpha/beta hydrolase [Pseudomonadales bacterium]NRA14662.1 alpha/beta hydrolase [Oceanospirillaceae bacterium]
MQIKHFDTSQISWCEQGTGEPVIFLHAMAGSATAWQPQFAYFANSYRCIAWDMPGFGNSPPCADNMQALVEMLEHFVHFELKLSSAHFVGLSVGGMILQHFSAQYPQRVKSLALLDTSPKFGLSGDVLAADFIKPILQALADGQSIADFSDGMIRAIVGPQCNEQLIRTCIASMCRASRAGLELCTHLIGNHNALTQLPKIRARTLVLVGADDLDTPIEYAAYLCRQIADATLQIIANAGHVSNLENPGAVNRALQSHLSKHL